MSTNANVLRSLRSPKWLRHTLRRRRVPLGSLQRFITRQRHETVEHARRAWAPRNGSFSFGDTPAERHARRRHSSIETARARYDRVARTRRHELVRVRRRGLAGVRRHRLAWPRALHSARARFSVTCVCGAVLGYGLFSLLLGS